MKKTFIIMALIAGAFEIQAQQSQTNYQSSAGMERTTAFQLSLTPDIAIYPRTTEVDGVSIGIWSENP
ncbi:MAG TPA: hypothetical protein VK810_06810, partial [Dongiaceae bacterium]|nr:hypothetical protein [Dongiaceae bacterium]